MSATLRYADLRESRIKKPGQAPVFFKP